MIKINVNKKKTIEFDVNVKGVQCDALHGRLSLFYEDIIYSFPADIEDGNVIKIEVPILNEIIPNIPDKHQADLKLEVVGAETYLMPWTGTAYLEHPVQVEATMRGTSKIVEEETPKIEVGEIREEEKEEKKEDKKEKKKLDALLKAADKKTPMAKRLADDEDVEEDCGPGHGKKKKKKSKLAEVLDEKEEDQEDKERRKIKGKKLGEELAKALLGEGKKRYREQHGVGKAKYTVSFHDGKKTHKDGSPFYDIKTFKNKKALDDFIKELEKKGYSKE